MSITLFCGRRIYELNTFIAEVEELQIGDILFNEPLSKHTTWKIGGPADMMILPKGKEELITLVRLLNKHHISWMSLGRGSNMLVLDKGVRGVVIKPAHALDFVEYNGNTVTVGAAYSLIKLATQTSKKGLSGLEFAGGIPANVGGAVYMNAGAHGSDVSRILKSADIILENGEYVTFTNEDMKYSYRHSVLHEIKGIVVQATFELIPGDSKEISAEMIRHRDRRLKTQPLKSATCGSVFRNPPGDFAARLIEEAGLKGYRVGGAQISLLHANFIENTGTATANDVLALITHIQAVIQEKFNIALTPEVLVVGER